MDSMLMQELFGEPTLITNSTFTKAEAAGMWRKESRLAGSRGYCRELPPTCEVVEVPSLIRSYY